MERITFHSRNICWVEISIRIRWTGYCSTNRRSEKCIHATETLKSNEPLGTLAPYWRIKLKRVLELRRVWRCILHSVAQDMVQLQYFKITVGLHKNSVYWITIDLKKNLCNEKEIVKYGAFNLTSVHDWPVKMTVQWSTRLVNTLYQIVSSAHAPQSVGRWEMVSG
jgi:hypothetical protein